MHWQIYLSGEIHTSWREEIIAAAEKENLPIKFFAPVTDHAASDDCGVKILGNEDIKYWHDNKGAKINAIRTRKGIEESDIVVVKYGEKYESYPVDGGRFRRRLRQRFDHAPLVLQVARGTQYRRSQNYQYRLGGSRQ